MICAIDFDDTIVEQTGRDYADVKTPLKFMPGAKDGLVSLKRAGHILVLFSGRANRALRFNPIFDPLVRAGARFVDKKSWEASAKVNEARYQQMLDFVAEELPDVFDAIDDGQCGKVSADLYIDDKAVRFGYGANGMIWRELARVFGDG